MSNFDNARVLVACNYTTHGVPTAHAHSFADFCASAADLIRTGRVVIITEYDPQIDLCRSRFALAATNPNNQFTHLFQFDADMEVNLEHVDTLLGRNVDVVSGTYFMRGAKDTMQFPCVSTRDGKYITREEIASARVKDELIPVHGVGGGCLLATVDALRRVGQPTFRFDFHIGDNWFHRSGEDSYFSNQVRNAGMDVWLDPTVTPWHISTVKVGFDLMDHNGVPIYTPNY